MRKYILSTLLLATTTTFTANGALLVKKTVAMYQSHSATNAAVATAAKWESSATEYASSAHTVRHLPRHRNLGELPKGVYIAMCILPLGWLAIAINSNFTENEWIFALLWYVLLYLPGVYYSLRQMKRFYGR